jgi:hypothetical protein
MGQEQQDLIAALAAATILLRKLEEGVPALLVSDEFRTELRKVCEKLQQRLDEVSAPK